MYPHPSRRTTLAALAAASSVILFSCAGSSAPDPAATAATATPAPAAPAPSAPAAVPRKEMSQDEMMARFQAAATPGKHHALLEAFRGNWDVTVSFWMSPDGKPEVSSGTSSTDWLLGGRWLQQRHVGTAMGAPFEGMGMLGYDMVQGKYIGTWVDSMSTSMSMTEGSVDESGTRFTFRARNSDPLTGTVVEAREEVVIEGPDRHVVTMHALDPATGHEFKKMEIVFQREGTKQP